MYGYMNVIFIILPAGEAFHVNKFNKMKIQKSFHGMYTVDFLQNKTGLITRFIVNRNVWLYFQA